MLDSGSCRAPAYTCSNGTIADDRPDGTVDVERCKACGSGYKLDNDRCVATRYTCSNGTVADGTPDGNADAEQCKECDTKFMLSDGRCVIATLTNVANVDDSDNSSYELKVPQSVTTATIGDTSYLFVAGYFDSGVSVFSIANNGTVTNVHNVPDGGNLELQGAASVATATINGTPYLFVAGEIDSGVSVFSVANNGALTNVHNVPDSGDLELEGATSVATAVIGTTTYLFVAGRNDNGVSVFSIANNGALTNVHNVPDGGDLELSGASSVTTAVIGTTTYLFVAGRTDNGVSVFSVGDNGSLTNVHNVSDSGDLELAGAYSVTTAVIGTTTYLFIAGFNDNGVSVFSVADNGALTNEHNVSGSGDLELSGASSVTTATIGGTPYLFVAGSSDNSVSVFSVADDGALTNVHNEPDSGDLELGGASSVATATIGTVTYLIVAGLQDNGFSVFLFP